MEIKVDAEELKKLNDILKDFLKKNKEATFKGMVDCGWAVRSKAINIVPVDTGRLRGSIAVEEDENKMEVMIGTNVKYAPYVEFGTCKMAARPYLRPAYYENIDKIMDFIKRRM